MEHARFTSLVHALDTVAQAREPNDALVELCRLAVPAHADVCSLDLAIDERRFVQAIGVRGDDRQAQAFARVYPAQERVPLVVREVTATGHARTIEAPDEQVLWAYAGEQEVHRLLTDLPCRALVVAPLGQDPRRIGAITLGFRDHVPVQQDLAMQDLLRLFVGVIAHVWRALQAMEHARDLEKRTNDVLAIVSHELRAPLGAVRAAASLLQRAGMHPIAPRRLAGLSSTVLAAADRMSRLVADLQELARANDAELTVDLAAHDVDALVCEVLDTMAPLALSKGVMLNATTAQARVLCDRDRIAQVLCNLVGNAIKFNHAGGHVLVSLGLRGDRVHVDVRDDGPGIPRESLTRVFERRWQGSGDRAKGLGLGLFIACQLVRAHGSELTVDSDVGAGSTFSFDLRCAEVTGEAASAR